MFIGSNPALTVVFKDCNFKNNRAVSGGGAVFVGDIATLTVANGELLSNTVTVGSGGGFDLGLGLHAFQNVVFNDNRALNGNGGAIAMEKAGTVFLGGCTLQGNIATNGDGGTVSAVQGGSLIAGNTLFWSNAAIAAPGGGNGVPLAQFTLPATSAPVASRFATAPCS